MCGTLFGTLPQAQQQNIFHGLPLELMKEEARLLVEKGAAIIVDDVATHIQAVEMLTEDDKVEILALKAEEQDKLAEANREESLRKKEIAIKHAKSSGKWKDKPPKPPKAKSATETEASGAKSDGTQKNNEDTGPRQYIIPMTSSPIGQYSLEMPESSLHTPDTPVARYEVYKYLQSRGYFLSPGLRFGCQFVAYPGDPLRFHSHFLVKSLDWDEEMPILDLVGGGRLGTGVKKAWMIAGKSKSDVGTEEEGIKEENANGGMRAFCIEWGGFG
ncbi:hypothetical protein ABW19_dt0209890 [Dactylella cylindrospora]|nr:hypothetical protein ABW19_dt0209890 [Dactylella cylindrospora]